MKMTHCHFYLPYAPTATRLVERMSGLQLRRETRSLRVDQEAQALRTITEDPRSSRRSAYSVFTQKQLVSTIRVHLLTTAGTIANYWSG